MAAYAHFALQKLGILPSVFAEMEESEKAFVVASIIRRCDDEKRLQEAPHEHFK